MDKYTENFYKDNPIFHFICPNPKCKNRILWKVKTYLEEQNILLSVLRVAKFIQ